jgi:hypothetical protein
MKVPNEKGRKASSAVNVEAKKREDCAVEHKAVEDKFRDWQVAWENT